MARPAHDRRHLGSLDGITDSERNALRPIGRGARETALLTGSLLAGLRGLPGVLVFQGVLPAGEDIPRIPHVVSAGRRVVLVESVAWPPGTYGIAEDGRIHCDGVYIGQSVRPLLTAVRYWREALPRDHGVSAVVVVHHADAGDLALPRPRTRDVAWASAEDALRIVLLQVFAGRRAASSAALKALSSATRPG